MRGFIDRRLPELLGILTALVVSFFVFPLDTFWMGSAFTLPLLIALDWFFRKRP